MEAKYADWNLTADADGNVSVADLQNATNGMFNNEAVERSFNALLSLPMLMWKDRQAKPLFV